MANNSDKEREEVIQHLQMIQAVITRMNSNSFSLKRWSLALLLALIVLYSNAGIDIDKEIVAWFGLFAIVVFWYLDSFYLWQERGYVALYNKIRKQKKTDFAMRGLVGEVKFVDVLFSKTIFLFYGVLLLSWFFIFIFSKVVNFLVIRCGVTL